MSLCNARREPVQHEKNVILIFVDARHLLTVDTVFQCFRRYIEETSNPLQKGLPVGWASRSIHNEESHSVASLQTASERVVVLKRPIRHSCEAS